MLNSKFWQGFFALAPILIGVLAIIFYFFFIFNLITSIEANQAMDANTSASIILGNFAWFFGFVMLTILISVSSMIFFIVHAVQNPNLKENNLLIVWILLFVFVSGIGQLIYWIVEIISKRKNIAA
ncbi:hypothetical protein MTsPCn9_02510 [Croceitalea sp. MTPC9]|nr:hypothetical protein MTsPCn6_06200 [Croceitalea sp. MTPC6]GMN15315.1 hypothetical protein MTsPCn9_02510 [Croceitalea sp. MTPC9]